MDENPWLTETRGSSEPLRRGAEDFMDEASVLIDRPALSSETSTSIPGRNMSTRQDPTGRCDPLSREEQPTRPSDSTCTRPVPLSAPFTFDIPTLDHNARVSTNQPLSTNNSDVVPTLSDSDSDGANYGMRVPTLRGMCRKTMNARSAPLSTNYAAYKRRREGSFSLLLSKKSDSYDDPGDRDDGDDNTIRVAGPSPPPDSAGNSPDASNELPGNRQNLGQPSRHESGDLDIGSRLDILQGRCISCKWRNRACPGGRPPCAECLPRMAINPNYPECRFDPSFNRPKGTKCPPEYLIGKIPTTSKRKLSTSTLDNSSSDWISSGTSAKTTALSSNYSLGPRTRQLSTFLNSHSETTPRSPGASASPMSLARESSPTRGHQSGIPRCESADEETTTKRDNTNPKRVAPESGNSREDGTIHQENQRNLGPVSEIVEKLEREILNWERLAELPGGLYLKAEIERRKYLLQEIKQGYWYIENHLKEGAPFSDEGEIERLLAMNLKNCKASIETWKLSRPGTTS